MNGKLSKRAFAQRNFLIMNNVDNVNRRPGEAGELKAALPS